MWDFTGTREGNVILMITLYISIKHPGVPFVNVISL